MPVRTYEEHVSYARKVGRQNVATVIDADSINWEAIGPEDDPRSRLLATVVIGGSHHHLEAREVVRPDEFTLGFKDWDEDYDTLSELAGDAPRETVEIEGREYILFMTPYS